MDSIDEKKLIPSETWIEKEWKREPYFSISGVLFILRQLGKKTKENKKM